MKRYRKIYIEITNVCNLQCTFCPEVEREKKIMSAENFGVILPKVAPFAEEICLHLMGEPLSHPEFSKIIDICEKNQVRINLTTNGTLLQNYPSNFFFRPVFKQINFSIHSYKDNFPDKNIQPYLLDILQFSKLALSECPELYINYRLWNFANTAVFNESNYEIIQFVSGFFDLSINEKIHVSHIKSKNLVGRIYFHFDSRFEWPSLNLSFKGENGFCYALSTHIGIHADGTIVPCCLDKEAVIPLGNLLQNNLEEIVNFNLALDMKNGFDQKKLIHPLCQKCSFIQRFNNKVLPRSL